MKKIFGLVIILIVGAAVYINFPAISGSVGLEQEEFATMSDVTADASSERIPSTTPDAAVDISITYLEDKDVCLGAYTLSAPELDEYFQSIDTLSVDDVATIELTGGYSWLEAPITSALSEVSAGGVAIDGDFLVIRNDEQGVTFAKVPFNQNK